MGRIVFIGSHLGYPMDRTPLGGGAMVGLQLVRHWARGVGQNGNALDLAVVGPGSHPPAEGVRYIQLPPGDAPDLVRKTEMGYARFCREFEAETTEFLKRESRKGEPHKTPVIVNDISESPDLAAVASMGFPIVSIWHVDVVEFFNRIYLKGILAPERLTRAFAWLEDHAAAGLVPDVLRLVFQKQREAVRYSRVLVLPSRQMAETIRRCYPNALARMLILPWGGWQETISAEDVAEETAELRKHYQIGPETRVLMTLSRISPEKGIHYLLEALRRLEEEVDFQEQDVCLFVCGETAFMRGEAYGKTVRAAAEKIRRFRVFFPGYLSARHKQAYFSLADLFVSPSVHESYGLTLVEAMRGGLPVLASDHYGVEEILKPSYGRTVSFRAEKQRPVNLKTALHDMLLDRDGLKKMGRCAKKAAEGMQFSDSARRLREAAFAAVNSTRGGA